MRTLLLTSVTVAALAALPAPPAHAAPASPSAPALQRDKKKAPKGYHQDTRYGFKFKKPKKFDNIAIKVEEEWLAAKYVSEKEYSYHDKDTGGTSLHAPEVLVIAFPHEAMKRRSNVKEDKNGDEVTITFENPYRDYDDFLTRTFTGGGFYKDTEEEDEIDGVKVTKLTYKVEKLARTGPQTISTWIYHSEDVDYAVQIVGLTKHWKAIEKAVKPIRNTFELIERDAPLKINSNLGITLKTGRMNLDIADKKEAKSVAVKSEKVIHERAIAKLPDEGWDHKLKGRVLTVFSADKKYADRVQRHTNKLLDWLDDEFGYLGGSAYLRKPIVRICKDRDEAAAYTAGVNSGGGGGRFVGDELTTWWDSAGWTGYGTDFLNRQIYQYWMLEKNFRLSTAMPEWIDVGLRRLVEQARLDARKPDWRYDAGLISYSKQLVREGKSLHIRDLFLFTSEEFSKRYGTEGNPFTDGALLINYLASPEMRRHKLAEDMLEDYLRAMIDVVEELEKKQKRKLDAARAQAKRGDGDREYTALRRQIFKEMEKELLEKTFEAAFGDMSEKDWETVNKHFRDAF